MTKKLILMLVTIAFLMTSYVQAVEYTGKKSFDIKKAFNEIKAKERQFHMQKFRLDLTLRLEKKRVTRFDKGVKS